MIWTVGKESGPKHIVMLISKPRSKWPHLVCFCKRRRKDGTCLLTDGIRPLFYQSARSRIRLEHPEIDKQLHRLPDPDPRAFELLPEVADKVAAA